MAEKWIGYTVSIDCGDTLGKYQGQICHVDGKDQTLTLRKAFRNGVPDPSTEVTLRAIDIKSLKIISAADDVESLGSSQSVVPVTKPIAKRPGRSISESLATTKTSQLRESPRKLIDDSGIRQNNANEGNRTPSKKDRARHKMSERDEACFGSSVDNILGHEFDFEKNLALFNKKAIYDEINASQRPDVIRQADFAKRNQKYRHYENVIESSPAAYRQIIVPAPGLAEYVTDDGLVIPSISLELRCDLLRAAEERGLTAERQIELMGRAATEMALQLLGGGHRLNPHNVHQWPTVVALCGPHRQGAYAVSCARQLASHGVKTVVFLLDQLNMVPEVRTEIQLYKFTGNSILTNTEDLPSLAVDLIILALLDEQSSTPERNFVNYMPAALWANECRAPVLALDPPAGGTAFVDTKFSLLPFLPLAHSSNNGKLYLCNLGCPHQVFEEIGIKYTSPFGPKFVIPLHVNDT